MARCSIRMPEAFLLACDRLADRTDAIIEKALEAGGEVVLARVRRNLQSVIRPDGQSTGELLGSLGKTTVKVDHKGVHNLKIGFNEPRRHQYAARGKRSYRTITNAMIATVIEYGKHNQPARPFLKPARTGSRSECVRVMTAALEEEIGKL